MYMQFILFLFMVGVNGQTETLQVTISSTDLFINDSASKSSSDILTTTKEPITIAPLDVPFTVSTTTQNIISILEPYEDREPFIEPDDYNSKPNNISIDINSTTTDDFISNKTINSEKEVIVFSPNNEFPQLQNITENDISVSSNPSVKNDSDVLETLEKLFENDNYISTQTSIFTNDNIITTTENPSKLHVTSSQNIFKKKFINSHSQINQTNTLDADKTPDTNLEVNIRTDNGEINSLIFSQNNNSKVINVTEKPLESISQTDSNMVVASSSEVTELLPRSIEIQEQSSSSNSDFQEQSCAGNCAQASSSSSNGGTKATQVIQHPQPSPGTKRGPPLKCGIKGIKKSAESIILHTVNLQKLQRSREKRALSSATATATAFSGFPGWGSGPAIASSEGKAFSQGGGDSIANGQATAFSGGEGPSIANARGNAFSNGGTAIGQGNSVSGGQTGGDTTGQGIAISNGPGMTISNGFGTSFTDGMGQSIASGHGNTFSTGNGIGLAQGVGNALGGGPGINNANGQGTSLTVGPGMSLSNGQGMTYLGSDGNPVAEGKGTVFNLGSAIGDGRGNAMAGDPNSANMQDGYAPYSVPNNYNPYNVPGASYNDIPAGYDPYSVPISQPVAYDPYSVPSSQPASYDPFSVANTGSPNSFPAGYSPYSMPSAPNAAPPAYNTYNSPTGYPAYNYNSPSSSSVPSGYENYASPSNTYSNPYSYGTPSGTTSYNSPYQPYGLKKREISITSENNKVVTNNVSPKKTLHTLTKRNIYNNNIYGNSGFNPASYLSYGLANAAAAASNSYGMGNMDEAPDMSDDEFLEDGLYGIQVSPTNGNIYGVSNSQASSGNQQPAYNLYSPTKNDAISEKPKVSSYNTPSYGPSPIKAYEEAAEELTSPSNIYGLIENQPSSGKNYPSQPPSYGYESSQSYNKPSTVTTYESYDEIQPSNQQYSTPSNKGYSSIESKPESSKSSPYKPSSSYDISEDTSTKVSYSAPIPVASYGIQNEVASQNPYSSSANPSTEAPKIDIPQPKPYGISSSETVSSSPSYGSVSQEEHKIPSYKASPEEHKSPSYTVTPVDQMPTNYAPPNLYGVSVQDTHKDEDYIVPTSIYGGSYGSEAANTASTQNTYNNQNVDNSYSPSTSYDISTTSSSSSNSYSSNTEETTTYIKEDVSQQQYNSESIAPSKEITYGKPDTSAYESKKSPEVTYTSHDAEIATQPSYSSPNPYNYQADSAQKATVGSSQSNGYSDSNPSSSYGAASDSSISSPSYTQSNEQLHHQEAAPGYATPQEDEPKDTISPAALYGVQSFEAAPSSDEPTYKTVHSQSSSSASASADSSTTVNIHGGDGKPTTEYSSSSSSSSSSSNTADIREYCWQAAIYLKGKYKCGGSLIRRQWILTAAHCIEGAKASEITVRLGENELSNGPSSNAQVLSIETVKMHSHYNSHYGMYDHDIALLKLNSPALLSDAVCLICLPGKPSEFFNGKQCTVTGYGSDSLGGQPLKRLKEISVPIVPSQKCEGILKNSIHDFQMHPSFMCAGGERLKDTCTGDGGSPLVCEAGQDIFVQVGLVAWGVGCGQAGVPAVYSDIYYFDKWIQESLQ